MAPRSTIRWLRVMLIIPRFRLQTATVSLYSFQAASRSLSVMSVTFMSVYSVTGHLRHSCYGAMQWVPLPLAFMVPSLFDPQFFVAIAA